MSEFNIGYWTGTIITLAISRLVSILYGWWVTRLTQYVSMDDFNKCCQENHDLRQRLAAQAPAWSQEAPKVEGWYWYKGHHEVTIVHIYHLVVNELDLGWKIGFQNGCHPDLKKFSGSWAGPIVPPEGTR